MTTIIIIIEQKANIKYNHLYQARFYCHHLYFDKGGVTQFILASQYTAQNN